MSVRLNGRPQWRVVLLSSLLVGSLGVGAGWLLAYSPQFVDENQAQGAQISYPIEQRDYADSHNVTLSVQAGKAASVHIQASGMVTDLSCGIGEYWEEGEAPLAVDGSPKVVLTTVSPMHRDLSGGETGSDVVALQDALHRLGYDVSKTGKFDTQTKSALAVLLKSLGVNAKNNLKLGAFWVDDFLWLETSSPIETCAVSLGDLVNAGDTIATLTPAITAMNISTPGSLFEGDRTLTVGETTVPVPPNNVISDHEAVAALLSEPYIISYFAQKSLAEDSVPPPSGLLELTEPIQVFAVPPSAIIGVVSDKGCVFDETNSHPVQVISSSLGLTYVGFPDSTVTPVSVLIQPPQGSTCG